jgi:hypothetical protein
MALSLGGRLEQSKAMLVGGADFFLIKPGVVLLAMGLGLMLALIGGPIAIGHGMAGSPRYLIGVTPPRRPAASKSNPAKPAVPWSKSPYRALGCLSWTGCTTHHMVSSCRTTTGQAGNGRSAFGVLGFKMSEYRGRLGLYPFPGNWVFERSLHFIARLEVGHGDQRAN